MMECYDLMELINFNQKLRHLINNKYQAKDNNIFISIKNFFYFKKVGNRNLIKY